VSFTAKLSAASNGGTARWRSGRRLAMALLVSAAIAVAPVSALAEGDGASMAKEAGIGAGTAIASLIYAPLKLVYAIGGLVVGGLAWGFSGGDSTVASTVLTPSLRGDYVVTRAQITGKQEIEFFGRRPEYRSNDDWDVMPVEEDVAAAPAERW
jgi:hypothetical protein